MIRRLFERAVPVTLICVLGVNVVLIALVLTARADLRSARAEYGSATGTDPLQPEAFERDGTRVELGDAGEQGVAVWFAASKCPFCQRDEEWRRLAHELEGRDVRVLVLLPSAADEFSEEPGILANAQQIAFISPEWIDRHPLSVTPTLLIFDARGRLIWHRYGMLSPGDVRGAISAVESPARAR